MDINTIAELINGFVAMEKEILNRQDIRHPTTIGDMFEGLTAEVLDRSIFNGLNLKIVKNSFIYGCETEFDVLLVEGEGKSIPYTNRFQYKPEQVIVVIQVKKNLYSKDIESGYDNLKFIINYYENVKPEEFILRLFRDSFRSIVKKDVSAKKNGELSKREDFLFDILKLEALLPVRVVWGYNGFSNEYNFRNSFHKYLSQNVSIGIDNKKHGFGPLNFPNLIISDKFSMFKTNGMPFIASVQEDEWWPLYATSSVNPVYYFLELIWTRLSYKFPKVSTDIFGDDLHMEPASKFLDCRRIELNQIEGWQYKYIEISNKQLKANTEFSEWNPVELDEIQYAIISKLCNEGEIELNEDKELREFVLENDYMSLDDFVLKLKNTGLVYTENNKLKLLTDQCQCTILPNGTLVAGENKSGRFTRWICKEMSKLRGNS